MRGIPSSISLPPIIERELRLAARRDGTYWGRVGAGTTGAVLFFTIMRGQLASKPPGAAGRITFTVLACVGALVMVSTVVQLAAGAFSREKREDTLGLLFLTPLRPSELATGKLLSTTLGAFYRFLAMLPMLALPMLVGGVSFGNFVLLGLALVNLVFFAGTVGLYFSARAWDERRAVASAVSALFGICVLLPLAGWMALRGFLMNYVAGLSPVFPVLTASAGNIQLPAFWWSMLVTQVYAWSFFRRTCRILPTCWQDKPVASEQVLRRDEPPPQQGWPYEPREAAAPSTGSWQASSSEAAEEREQPEAAPRRGQGHRTRPMIRRQFNRMRRQQLLEQNPILWLAQRWRADSSSACIVAAIGLVGPVIIVVSGEVELFLSPFMVCFVTYCVQAGFKTYVATQAALAFAPDRGEDTLELLLSTPISVQQIVEGHLQSVFESITRWVRRLFWCANVWMLIAVVVDVALHKQDTWRYLALFVGMLVMFVPDVRAVGWAALWQGVVSKNARVAASNAQGRVLGLPWLLTILGVVISGFEGEPWLTLGVLLLGFSLGMDAWVIRRTKRRLHRGLLLWARRRALGELEHYDAWRRLGWRLGRWWAGARR